MSLSPTPRLAALAAAVVGGLLAGDARAGFITPTSIPQAAGLVLLPENVKSGYAVPGGQQVTDQYGGLGVEFAPTALAVVNGASAWVPTGGGGTGPDGLLNFKPGNGSVILGRFVTPGSGAAATVSELAVEFKGVDPLSAAVVLLDGNGNPFSTIYGSGGVGPNGGLLVESAAGLEIGGFALYGLSRATGSADTIWGVTGLDFTAPPGVDPGPGGEDPDPEPNPNPGGGNGGGPGATTPEPGTLALATIGVGGAFVTRFRRRITG